MSGDQLDLDLIEGRVTYVEGIPAHWHGDAATVVALVAEVRRLREERDAYKKAKAENDERFQLDAAAWREEAEKWKTSFGGMRDLLMRYINHVGEEEGSTFLTYEDRLERRGISPEGMAVLWELEKEGYRPDVR